jgi:hypothetical protein
MQRIEREEMAPPERNQLDSLLDTAYPLPRGGARRLCLICALVALPATPPGRLRIIPPRHSRCVASEACSWTASTTASHPSPRAIGRPRPTPVRVGLRYTHQPAHRRPVTTPGLQRLGGLKRVARLAWQLLWAMPPTDVHAAGRESAVLSLIACI